MADGIIRIKIDVDGKELELTNKDLDKVEKSSHKAGAGIKRFAASLGLVAIGAVAFTTLKNSMDDAINRFDTLNKFPKVLQALGVSAEDSQRAMNRLADGIDGLPTKLNDIAQVAQRMYTSFNDMDKATDTALALNNALLGSGSSAEQASRGTEMYLKVLQTGQMDLQTWRSLSETMDVGLVKIAESFGYAGRTAKDDLYSALQDGTITLDQFNDALIEVGTGTGIMAKLARENTLGIATSFENLKTAAVRGLVEIIDAFNKLSKEVTGKEIAQNIDSLKRVVFTSFRAMAKVIEATTPVVVLFANGVKMAIPVVQALTPAIIGLMTAYGAYVVITKASTAIQVASAALKAATTTTVGASTAMASLTIVQQASTKAVQADMLIRALQNKQIGLGTIAIGLLTGKVSLATVAQMAMTVATNALGAALRFMMGPIGWVITAIGLLTTGVVALVKWFKRTSKEADRLNKETEELADANAQLADSVESSSKSYENSKDSIETTAKANQELIKQIEELSQKENKSAADKKLLQSYVDDLNESIEDLNLVYGEETDALSMSSEQLMKRVELMQEEEKMLASQERLTETIEEQIEIGKQLDEVNELREEWNQKLEDGEIKTREHTKAMVDLDNQQEELMETMKEATDARVEADRQLEESAERVAEMTEESIGRQEIMYEELSETQKQAIDGMKDSWEDYKDHATEMFDVLSDESEFTIEEMTKNLEENQRIMGEWADGIAELAERGVDQGLLDKLREAGPESAGHVNALVNASDDELEKLSETFAKGGETATDALSSALDIEKTEIIDKLGHLIVDTEKSLREQVKDADFESIGVDVVHGMAGGIDEKAYEAERAAKEMAEDVVDSTQETLGIASPSKVYREFGGDITDGLSLGVSRGTRKVINSAIKLLRSTISKFDGIYNRFNTIGQNAINGLNAGLNAGRGRVLSTARTIANQVAGTMQSALKINSPSHVMRDEVGKWIPAGVAEGIKRYSRMIDSAIDNMYDTVVPHTTPEVAIATNMGTNARGVGFSSDKPSTKTITNNNNPVIHIEKIENHSDSDIPQILEESAWILSREDKRL